MISTYLYKPTFHSNLHIVLGVISQLVMLALQMQVFAAQCTQLSLLADLYLYGWCGLWLWTYTKLGFRWGGIYSVYCCWPYSTYWSNFLMGSLILLTYVSHSLLVPVFFLTVCRVSGILAPDPALSSFSLKPSCLPFLQELCKIQGCKYPIQPTVKDSSFKHCQS